MGKLYTTSAVKAKGTDQSQSPYPTVSDSFIPAEDGDYNSHIRAIVSSGLTEGSRLVCDDLFAQLP